MSTLFNWNEKFLTGLAGIDRQHQRLVELINDLGELVISSETIDPQSFFAARDALLGYARTHFAAEETMMVQAGLDPRHIEPHRTAHLAFAAEAAAVGEFTREVSPEPSPQPVGLPGVLARVSHPRHRPEHGPAGARHPGWSVPGAGL